MTRAPVQLPIPPLRRFGSILIVDDEEPNRLLLRDLLEAQGYATSEASNGAEALESVAQRLPDLILLDIMMPGVNGYEVCQRLKQNGRTAHIPVLMVTAFSERKERLLGMQAGANDFLNKPVDIQDVVLRVRNALCLKGLYEQLKAEREKSEQLLLNILPKPIAERMKNGEVNIADYHPEATVLFADLAGFTALSALIQPEQIVSMLNEIFSEFDLLVEQLQLEKIKTVGDAYMVAGGIHSNRLDHTEAVAELALQIQQAMVRFNQQYNTSIRMRIGISTGSVVSGVIGRRKFAYDLWGPTVNLACQLQTAGSPGSVQVDQATYERLQNRFRFSGPRIVELKNENRVTIRTLAPYSSRPLPGSGYPRLETVAG
ncbi:MAG TPA: adenylate/guanylate cyclase domain-containing protein [Candidatus Binatia bacterium]|jgi:adenylate cyclase|nr:adenylate/guanylate cyclase domain-containing protein [Candidatus Binatia bacterium]